MVKNNPYSAMPNSLQIGEMIQAYAPWVYFHPDEQYFPSSVLLFFQNGVELHQPGQIPRPVINDGDNLPNNGGADDAFLDLPSDQPNKERVKKGFLSDAVVYIHVKSALGGTCTDLAIWLYYPFNGGGKFQLGPFTIDLGIIGEHVSDWEHITLRVDNFHGNLRGGGGGVSISTC
ncbi:putative vacuolar protein sorting-associated protein [Helianthus annuus]|nr:putative vacuolar protein sorting-associated protein [Helianthus annuus]